VFHKRSLNVHIASAATAEARREPRLAFTARNAARPKVGSFGRNQRDRPERPDSTKASSPAAVRRRGSWIWNPATQAGNVGDAWHVPLWRRPSSASLIGVPASVDARIRTFRLSGRRVRAEHLIAAGRRRRRGCEQRPSETYQVSLGPST